MHCIFVSNCMQFDLGNQTNQQTVVGQQIPVEWISLPLEKCTPIGGGRLNVLNMF